MKIDIKKKWNCNLCVYYWYMLGKIKVKMYWMINIMREGVESESCEDVNVMK